MLFGKLLPGCYVAFSQEYLQLRLLHHKVPVMRGCRDGCPFGSIFLFFYFSFCRELPKLFEFSYLVTGPQRVVFGWFQISSKMERAMLLGTSFFFFFLSSSSDPCLSRILSVESFLDFMAWFLALTCM